MAIYESEKEQVDALKRWWKENGRTVIVGLVLGLGAVVGWTYWQNHVTRQAQQASMLYAQLVDSASNNKNLQAKQQGETLLREFPNSGYAAFAALILAKNAFAQNEVEAAKRHLRWALEHAERREVQLLARLRLARLLLSEQLHEEALALLKNIAPGGFIAAYEETRGDILVAQEKPEEARSAYIRSLAAMVPTGADRERVQMKLDDLGALNYGAGTATEDTSP